MRTKEQIDQEIAKLQAERESLEEWPRDDSTIFYLDLNGEIDEREKIVFDWWKKQFANYNIFRSREDAELAKEYRLMDARCAAGVSIEWKTKINQSYIEMMTRTYGRKAS